MNSRWIEKHPQYYGDHCTSLVKDPVYRRTEVFSSLADSVAAVKGVRSRGAPKTAPPWLLRTHCCRRVHLVKHEWEPSTYQSAPRRFYFVFDT